MDRAMENLAKAKATLARNLDRLFPSGIIRSDEPDAVQRLQAEIDEATRLQEKMKAANKIIRTAGLSPDDKVARLKAECGLEEMPAQALLKPDFAGRIGYPDFKLTNNSANIRRMQARLLGLKREAAKPSVVVHFPGGRMEDDSTLHRVRIFHDSKPAREEIDRIKLRGFHWSPRERCWQRLRNDSARAAAAVLTGITWPAPGGPPSHVPTPLVAPVTKTAAGGRSMRLTP